jgi:hypothetical protein
MTTRYMAIISLPVKEEEILEAKNLFPNVSTTEALRLLLNQIYYEFSGKTYEEDGSLVEVVEVQ